MKTILFISVLIVSFAKVFAQSSGDKETQPYLNVFKTAGENPVQFVNEKIKKYNLLIFDDGLHAALEPFKFYNELISNKEFKEEVGYIFLEVFSVKSQPYIDKYLNSPVKDSSILFPVFQDDFTGYGFRYKTYFDLFSAVWDVNKDIPDKKDKLHIIAVDQPISWCGINSSKDYELFEKSLTARDYFMYQSILSVMEGFKSDKKGIFLTNTRHAYKLIKNSGRIPYWNCGTFFTQMNPGKTYSIRIHNVTLSIEKAADTSGNKSIQGLEAFDYKWVRMEKGKWDYAFREYGNKPVAIPLKDNVFGNAKYVGNSMLNVLPGETMYDAYDAVIFLVPIESTHFSAMVDWIYTPEFKKELERRILAINDGNTGKILEGTGTNNMNEYIESVTAYKEETINPLINSLGSIDEWEKTK